jgi:hypothetical protein
MAKKEEKKALGGIFDKTERKPREKKADPMVPFSVSIRQSEAEEFLKTIEKTGFTRAEIGRYAINYFIKQYNEGKVKLQTAKVVEETLKAP